VWSAEARGNEAADAIPLLEADAELGALLSAERREQAARALIVRVERLAPGTWDPAGGVNGSGHVGVLVLDGVLTREVVMAEHVSAELLGPGDVVDPWRRSGRAGLLRVETTWTVIEDATVAVLDRRFATEAARFPEITFALFDRLAQRAQRLATTQAISQLTRVDRRLTALFWHLAERWGRVSGDGVVVPLPLLTHGVLGRMIGARRPTVSTALSQLAERGDVLRREDGSWLLRGDPPRFNRYVRRPRAAAPAHAG
jgi:CRP/FNR family cyclic AMP-dependent transcriptional regulator